MGMFDYIRCELPLPAPAAEGLEFQTKDTPAQWLDQYVIRADGMLWHEVYDIEDRSDPNAEGLLRLCGAMTRVNQRWECLTEFFGEVFFYKFEAPQGWLEFRARFVDGKLHGPIALVQETSPDGVSEHDPQPEAVGALSQQTLTDQGGSHG